MNESYGKIVREGRWIYAGAVEAGVRIRENDRRYGTGDHEDLPEIREDAEVRSYFVEWFKAGSGLGTSLSGPFDHLSEAEAAVLQQSRGSVRWLDE